MNFSPQPVQAQAGADQAHSPRRARVGFVSSHPIQYTAPLYASLNRSDDIEPVVLYLTDYSCRGAIDRQFGESVLWDVDLLSGYEYHFIGKNWQTADPYGFWSLRSPALWHAVRHSRLDALVLHGHQYAANLIALAAARSAGIPVFYKAETHLALHRGGMKAKLRPLALRILFAAVSGFLAIGIRNTEFYRSLGVPDARIFRFPYSVDNDRFEAMSDAARPGRAGKLRALGLDPARPTVLFASKLMARKFPQDVIASCAALQESGTAVQVIIAGSGEMDAKLKEQAAAHPALPVAFPGFINQSELPALFAAADVFVLPSKDEPWGLIVNEAMASALPVVASREIGCVADLVIDGENGASYPAGDVAALTEALRPILDDPAARRRMGKCSRDIIANYSYRQNEEGLRAALLAVAPTSLAR